MTQEQTIGGHGAAVWVAVKQKLKDYLQLVKLSLSIMVVFSSVVSYELAPNIVSLNWKMVLLLALGGILVTGSANAINQVVEKDTDAKMKRTANRPVASGRMSESEAWVFAFLAGVLGIGILQFFFSWQAAALSGLSLFLYAFIYTPLKKVNSSAVLVGAFPGALPCLIGWAAAFDTGPLFNWTGGLILFGIQFLWQFPHFWAIAWLAHGDYSRAGFKLLPSDKGPTRFSAVQAVIYALAQFPVGVLPYAVHMSGIVSLGIVALANVFLLVQCIRLLREMSAKAARRVMFSSYIYLPVVFLALLFDKVHQVVS
ncbi:heme o synthase [Dinghuibacter silviterrae]|uniref:Protoheme IX farnesyltransferase n=1 Tax=Dinghuibacter silviterrae TaxID=1539049 RepID=A0A4R8DNP7_9BACT|nr:heme o synthase [Dinghuibacter silviterrae]TDW99643.1 protoheme IX farnesyltransferase [Dinghuibacter silviterrae]